MKCLEPLSVKWWWKHFGTAILDPCLHTTVRSANPCRNICPRLSLAASKVGGFQIRLKLSWKSWRTDMLKCRLGPWRYLENLIGFQNLGVEIFSHRRSQTILFEVSKTSFPLIHAKLQSVWWQRLARKGWALRMSNCERNYRCENQDLGFYNTVGMLLVRACSWAIVQWPQLV